MRIAVLIFLISLPLSSVRAQNGQEPAREIIKKSDALMRGETLVARYSMTVVRPRWKRSMSFKLWSVGTDKAFVEMLSPAKNEGVTFLKIDREMWNYIPKINRVIKIPPSMMMQSWMGSDFTNDDLVRESSVVEDYRHTLLRREIIGDAEAYVIELKPKPEAAVVWDKVIEWIGVDDYIPMRAEYFNERGELVRTLLFSEVRQFGKRKIPTKIELLEERKPDHKTVMVLEEAVFDEPVSDRVFTKENLRRAQ